MGSCRSIALFPSSMDSSARLNSMNPIWVSFGLTRMSGGSARSRCAWESLKDFLQAVTHEKNPVPGAAITIQTFGDVLGYNPHCHILVTDGCFYTKGMFRIAPSLELKKIETIFRHKVFCMLVARGKISREMIFLLSTW